MTAPRGFICGLAGHELSAGERGFLRDADPFGIILFSRNCAGADQIRRLLGEVRAVLGRDDVAVLIDQEGGRVARLRPPLVPAYPPGRVFGAMEETAPDTGVRAARIGARLIAHDLAVLGINVDCMPVLDVPALSGHQVIGDRAYGADPALVSRIGRAVVDGLQAGGVLPVIKHLPGHGRARADSHFELPVVDADAATLAASDFAPFTALRDAPFGMTAHIRYTALDSDEPATLSKAVICEVIRGAIGFDGCLMTDDLAMRALRGSMSGRAAAAIAAGCDLVLHCAPDLREMADVAAATPELAGEAQRRACGALAARQQPDGDDIDALRATFAALLAEHEARLARL